ncbi:MAG: hypothetical protein KBD77_06710, partial [Brachymonas sp.]|nr:hypothetical protein [Brachymonas sp.]
MTGSNLSIPGSYIRYTFHAQKSTTNDNPDAMLRFFAQPLIDRMTREIMPRPFFDHRAKNGAWQKVGPFRITMANDTNGTEPPLFSCLLRLAHSAIQP